MTSRERLRRCFFHEPLDRPGVFCRTGFPADDPSYEPLRRLLAQRSELKRPWSATSLVEPLPVESHTRPHSPDFDLLIDTLKTPGADLVRHRMVSRTGQPGMTVKPYLSSRGDARAYLSLPVPRVGGTADRFFDLDREVGDRGTVDVSVGFNPAGHAAELLGSENFAFLSVTDRDVLHAVCQRHRDITLALVDHLIEQGVGPYFSTLGQEYVAPPMHGPEDFFDFNVRYDQPIIERIHEAGGRVHVHCHGSIRTVFDGFLQMGADVLHPFEAPPMGDITPAKAKALARGRICLEGNIQIADMYEKSPGEIAEQTRALIDTCFDDQRGLIVCPSASPWIPGAGARCLEQFRAMIQTVQSGVPS